MHVSIKKVNDGRYICDEYSPALTHVCMNFDELVSYLRDRLKRTPQDKLEEGAEAVVGAGFFVVRSVEASADSRVPPGLRVVRKRTGADLFGHRFAQLERLCGQGRFVAGRQESVAPAGRMKLGLTRLGRGSGRLLLLRGTNKKPDRG